VCLLLLLLLSSVDLQVFGRAAKYSLFDPSKEMVFITMDKAQKAAGKAAVDILGNQIGKSSGSWIMQVRCGAVNALSANRVVRPAADRLKGVTAEIDPYSCVCSLQLIVH
jgi:ATP/ADP translocase